MRAAMTTPAGNPPAATPPATEARMGGLVPVDVNEYGGKKDGERQMLNRRLFMQLVVFDVPEGGDAGETGRDLAGLLHEDKVPGVVYADAMAPRGLGLLTWHEDPAHFVTAVRPLFARGPLRKVTMRPSFAMIGRTYSTGHEPELEHVLLRRPVEYVMKQEWPWHVWYPLRRTGAFARLEPQEQGAILKEHAHIGFSYGQADLAHDVRLACHGLDAADNEFVIGLVGRELYPLSHLVQAMRKTKQTSEFIAQMGPFFVGMVTHRNG